MTDRADCPRSAVLNLDHLAQGRSCCLEAVRGLASGSYTAVWLFKQKQRDEAPYLIDISDGGDAR